MRNPSTADRGVSTTLGYVLTLAITAILISGLLIAGGTLVEDQRDRVAQEELAVSVEQLAAGLNEGDRLAQSADGGAMRVRVWLPGRVAGGAYTLEISNEPTGADQPARATIVAVAQNANARASVSLRTGVPVANRTLLGGPVVVSHKDADGDDARELVVNESSGLSPQEPEPAAMAHVELVFVDAETGNLTSLAPDGSTTDYGVAATAVGPKQVDIDDDGLREIPYVAPDGSLNIIDAAGEGQMLAGNGGSESPEESQTVLTIEEWNGEYYVLYANANGNAYRVSLDSAPTQIGANVNGNGISAIAGVDDLDDDGVPDLVSADGSQQLRYYEDGASSNVKVSNGGLGASTGIGVGAPRDFDGDGRERVPMVDGSNRVRLIHADGRTAQLASGAVKTALTGIDWASGTSGLEIVYVDKETVDGSTAYVLKYIPYGGGTPQTITVGGEPVTVEAGPGVA